jgi:hypothetical protein
MRFKACLWFFATIARVCADLVDQHVVKLQSAAGREPAGVYRAPNFLWGLPSEHEMCRADPLSRLA